MATYDKEKIVLYVEGELSPDEQAEIETALQQDPALAAEVALCRELRTSLQERMAPDPGEAALRNTLQRMRGQHFGTGAAPTYGADAASDIRAGAKGRVIPFKKILAGVAAAAVLLFAVLRLWPSGSYIDRYGETTMFSNTERGAGNDSLMAQASDLFNAKEYAKALPLLDQAYKSDSSNQTALFYSGVSRLYLGAIADGRTALEKIYNGTSILKYEAAFYIALSYAQQGDKALAREWLKKIPDGAPNADKAKELSKKLE